MPFCNVDSTLQLPELSPSSSGERPELPERWQCTALLHPFSPPPQEDPQPGTPFFQLCTATIGYIDNQVLSVQIVGCSYGEWWYKIGSDQTELSTDRGNTWTTVDMGWTLPSRNWLSDQATCVGKSYINWMAAQMLDWWKQPVEKSEASAPAATWFWFESEGANAGLPFRLMFGNPPPAPEKGDPEQLAFFQNFSFTYFSEFRATFNPVVDQWSPSEIPGFQPENPSDYKKVIWNDNFGMTAFMTPVNANFAPLPTRVFYKWKPPVNYQQLTDRGQSTLMYYTYNPDINPKIKTVEALLFGSAPKDFSGPPPPNNGLGFSYTIYDDIPPECEKIEVDGIPIGQQPPEWAYLGKGIIHACVTNNPALCPDQTVTISSVIFPPSDEYPQGRFLWTWYSVFPGSNGTHSRPVTFMESASAIGVGTSLALADYFDYQELTEQIPSSCLQLPAICQQPALKTSTLANINPSFVTHAVLVSQSST